MKNVLRATTCFFCTLTSIENKNYFRTRILSVSTLLLILCTTTFAINKQDQKIYYYANSEVKYLEPDYSQVMITFRDNVEAIDVTSFTGKYAALSNAVLHQPENAIVFSFATTSMNYEQLYRLFLADIQVVNVFPAFKTDGITVFVSNTMLYKLKNHATTDDASRILGSDQEAILQQYDLGFSQPSVEVKLGRFVNTIDAANRLQESGIVEFAQPNFIYTADENLTPNDPSYTSQWFLNNTGQSGGTVDADIDAPEAWNLTTGSSSVVVAIIDGNGYQLTHPELSGKYTSAYDAVNNDNDPSPENSNANHGTCVAGIVAAATNNSAGVASVGFNILVSPNVIGYNASSSGTFNTSDAIIAAAASHIVATSGVVAVSNSYSGLGSSSSITNSFTSLRNNCRGGLGAVVLCSSGNSGTQSILSPASLTGNIAVGATTNKDKKTSYSTYGNNLDLVAPGDNIYTTDRTGNSGYNTASTSNGGDFVNFSGTSGSCPIAAAVVGLMASVNTTLTRSQLETNLQTTTDKVGGVSYTNSAQHPLGTWNKKMGYGRVNAYQAVLASLPGPLMKQAGPINPFEAEDQVAANRILADESFGVYPNPVKAGQSIIVTNISEFAVVRLLSLDSKSIMLRELSGENEIEIPGNLKSGMYILNLIKKDGSTSSQKIMIQ